MKKQFATACLLGIFLVQFSLNAQVNLSGNLGLNYVKSDGAKEYFYNVTPKIGFEINDNVIIGWLVGYSGYSQTYNGYGYYGSESYGMINIGLYSRFNTFGSEKIRLLIEPSFTMGIDKETTDLMINFLTVPIVQLRITEKVYFDMTFGLAGLSLLSFPDYDYLEINFGLNNDSGVLGVESQTLTPLELGLTFSL